MSAFVMKLMAIPVFLLVLIYQIIAFQVPPINISSGSMIHQPSDNTISRLSPTLMSMERIVNLRDLHSASPNKMTAGVVYRCGSLSRATAEDAEKFKSELKVRTYIDLRSKTEVNEHLISTLMTPILLHISPYFMH